MKQPDTRYLTTSIPYVNAPPHVGFAMEMIQADCLARHYRLEGHTVRFQAGTDENSLKNVQAAEAIGVPVETLVGRNAARFYELKQALDLSFDDFIRTSADPRHRAGVEKLWAACAANGDIYKRPYSGLYCTGCEQFYKPSELNDGCCPEHGTAPEEVFEENYFFRLSRYQEELRRVIASGEVVIVPNTRCNEVRAWIDRGLEDFSISRSATRARGWGIPVPGDPNQVIYVWFDALGNYITALDYATDGGDFAKFWRAASKKEHVIGKGITRFHALYWPAILLSAGLPLPTRILVHGYVTVEGRKIGKSAGNTVDPVPIAKALGSDALRYYLLRHIKSTEDGDFSQERCLQAHGSELADQLGNLAHRTLSMINQYCGGIIPAPVADRKDAAEILSVSGLLPGKVKSHLEEFSFHDALAAIWAVISIANKYVADQKPWALAKMAANHDDGNISAGADGQLRNCLSDLAISLSVIGQCLAPLLPSTSTRLLSQLGMEGHRDSEDIAGNSINTDQVLFPKLQ